MNLWWCQAQQTRMFESGELILGTVTVLWLLPVVFFFLFLTSSPVARPLVYFPPTPSLHMKIMSRVYVFFLIRITSYLVLRCLLCSCNLIYCMLSLSILCFCVCP